MISSNPIPPGWATRKLGNNYIAEVLPQESGLGVPCQAPQPEGLALEEELPENLPLKASGARLQELYRPGGNRLHS